MQESLGVWLSRPIPALAQIDIASGYASLGTSTGLVRTENQDKVLAARIRSSYNHGKSTYIFAVCDGMGGMQEGELAARIAMSTFVSAMVATDDRPLQDRVCEAAHYANVSVNRRLQERGGTTLTAVAIESETDAQIFAVHVGDSRLYRYAKSAGLHQITTDDTLAGLVKNRNAAGNEEVPGRKGLLQYVGMGEGLDPHVMNLKFGPEDDLLLLVTDGVYAIGDELSSSILYNAERPSLGVQRLLRVANWTGGRDNASAVICDLKALFPIRHGRDNRLSGVEAYDAYGQFDFWWPPESVHEHPERVGREQAVITPRQNQKRIPKRRHSKKVPRIQPMQEPVHQSERVFDERSTSEKPKPQIRIDFTDE
ncbi:serine/threonine-protein phosphatase [Skermanella mucosa]|uniref:PP2C family protein-serine/threonine phosphatase n=1 Tax=Skermanella mucosa TaxID=1789672 RepID=UPI001E49CD39|nr:PP2C family serine/threonine-protein phosphatase [Skermanella mucosa]UEM23092.1 serine/threonine-protein phosphatase [Skermanella mucosa]